MITPEGRAYCGEQVSLDLHTVAAGTTEEIWAPPGEEAVLVLLEGDVEWAGAHAVYTAHGFTPVPAHPASEVPEHLRAYWTHMELEL